MLESTRSTTLARRRPAFPQGRGLERLASRKTGPKPYNWGINWAHTAIIPRKSPIDAKAAASSTKTLNMTTSLIRT